MFLLSLPLDLLMPSPCAASEILRPFCGFCLFVFDYAPAVRAKSPAQHYITACALMVNQGLIEARFALASRVLKEIWPIFA